VGNRAADCFLTIDVAIDQIELASFCKVICKIKFGSKNFKKPNANLDGSLIVEIDFFDFHFLLESLGIFWADMWAGWEIKTILFAPARFVIATPKLVKLSF
jgi:hypothetical protein